MSKNKIMSFDDFKVFLSDVLGVAEVAMHRETHFMGDLAVDSLKLVELMLQFEHQLGIDVPTDAAWEIQTVGEAYDYYVKQVQSAESFSG